VQPPLGEARGHKEALREEVQAEGKVDDYDVNPDHEAALLAGTQRWAGFPIHGWFPRARGCWVEVESVVEGSEGSENVARREAERWWPQRGLKVWSWGAWLVSHSR
jgi:hypothetical protein